MEDSINIKEELKEKNQEMLINKKRKDLDTAMESIEVFFGNYTSNVASEINEKVCLLRNINTNSEQGTIFYNTITTFLYLSTKKLRNVIDSMVEPLKTKIDSIPDEEYRKVLNQMVLSIKNKMTDYYAKNVSMLSGELNQDVDDNTKEKINNYLFEVTTVKIINMLNDKFMFAIGVINNNNNENKEVMESINEKTIKGV